MTHDTGPKPTAKRDGRPNTGSRRLALAVALVGACAVGAGATDLARRGHGVTLVALVPAPINAMKPWSAVAIKGQVSEIFGNKFVVDDGSGRALVETGPKGDNGDIVAKAETVTVQGRFEHGFVHAVAIQHADGRADVVGPPAPPRPGPLATFAPRPGLAER